MTTAIPGVGIEDLNPLNTVRGDELLEITVPVTLANGQKTHRSFNTTVNKLLALYGSLRNNPNGVTASQTGAYTIEEVNQIIASKFGEDGAAFNAMRLDGSTKQEIIEEARAGTAANSERLGGQTPDHYAKTQEFDALVDTMIETFNSYSLEEV